MENILPTINLLLALVAFILLTVAIHKNNKLIDKFKDENSDLRFDNEELSLQLDNAERRVVKYAIKIKTIEDIITNNNKKNEYDTITLAQIKKELFANNKQDK